ncbi:tumor susceptibility gene 101 protein [Halichoeres trimaculatus]|uniref:tumor susceptibility gene 101 protein n=1 Tax=Halichoeres trimaculatus TaxID=147232 RepID=UPI003D9EA924
MAHFEEKIRKMLPKAYSRKLVAREISTALTHFKHLVPVMDKYFYNDGTSKDLMSLTGTIPAKIGGKIFNIPVCLWLEEHYPYAAPICYVRPTREMKVLSGEFMSSNGEVMLPYLNEWKNGQCDLGSLLQVMRVTFEENPPVCSLLHQPQPEPSFNSCCMQFHSLPQIISDDDGGMCLCIGGEDGLPFQPKHETNC